MVVGFRQTDPTPSNGYAGQSSRVNSLSLALSKKQTFIFIAFLKKHFSKQKVECKKVPVQGKN